MVYFVDTSVPRAVGMWIHWEVQLFSRYTTTKRVQWTTTYTLNLRMLEQTWKISGKISLETSTILEIRFRKKIMENSSADLWIPDCNIAAVGIFATCIWIRCDPLTWLNGAMNSATQPANEPNRCWAKRFHQYALRWFTGVTWVNFSTMTTTIFYLF